MKRLTSSNDTITAITEPACRLAPTCSPSDSVAATSKAAKPACTAQALNTTDIAET